MLCVINRIEFALFSTIGHYREEFMKRLIHNKITKIIILSVHANESGSENHDGGGWRNHSHYRVVRVAWSDGGGAISSLHQIRSDGACGVHLSAFVPSLLLSLFLLSPSLPYPSLLSLCAVPCLYSQDRSGLYVASRLPAYRHGDGSR